MKVKVDMDVNKVISEKMKKIHSAQILLDQTVAKDSNYYVPKDTGTLESSVLTGSKMGSGELIWNTEYAKEQYYDKSNKSKDLNPNASMKWFERAKAVKLKEWEKITNDKYNS